MNTQELIGTLAFVGALVYAIWKVASGASSQVTSSIPDVAVSLDVPITGPDGSDVDTLARTIYGEARGESDAGKQGVASVVMNRLMYGSYGGWPNSVAAICTQPKQFSCWNSNDPNLPVIESVDASDPVFQDCLDIAQAAIAGSISDNTGGATFYHDISIKEPASWQRAGYVETTQIGRFIFYAISGTM
jgi:N-acetylmuramoyl-L-alanine amidase